MSNCFIILAAGKGKRFKSKIPKQFTIYKRKPIYNHSLEKIIIKKTSNRNTLIIKSVCKLSSFNWTILLSIKVKKVIKHAERVIKKIDVINKFLFKKVNIN